MFFGTALGNFGVREMLDDFVQWAPAPLSRDTMARPVDAGEEKFSVKTIREETLYQCEQYFGRPGYLRVDGKPVISAKLHQNDEHGSLPDNIRPLLFLHSGRYCCTALMLRDLLLPNQTRLLLLN